MSIPIGTVPFTLQVLFVLLASVLLGPRLAMLSVLAYLALGLVAPVYAGGTSGLGVLFGPTGGHLWRRVWHPRGKDCGQPRIRARTRCTIARRRAGSSYAPVCFSAWIRCVAEPRIGDRHCARRLLE